MVDEKKTSEGDKPATGEVYGRCKNCGQFLISPHEVDNYMLTEMFKHQADLHKFIAEGVAKGTIDMDEKAHSGGIWQAFISWLIKHEQMSRVGLLEIVNDLVTGPLVELLGERMKGFMIKPVHVDEAKAKLEKFRDRNPIIAEIIEGIGNGTMIDLTRLKADKTLLFEIMKEFGMDVQEAAKGALENWEPPTGIAH